MANRRAVEAEFERLRLVTINTSVKDIFGFDTTPPTLREVTRAYSQMVQQLHPDMGGAHDRDAAQACFDTLKRAFDIVVAAANYEVKNGWLESPEAYVLDESMLFTWQKTQAEIDREEDKDDEWGKEDDDNDDILQEPAHTPTHDGDDADEPDLEEDEENDPQTALASSKLSAAEIIATNVERKRKRAAASRRKNQKTKKDEAKEALRAEAPDAAWEPLEVNGDRVIVEKGSGFDAWWKFEQHVRHAFSSYGPQFGMKMRLTCDEMIASCWNKQCEAGTTFKWRCNTSNRSGGKSLRGLSQ